MINNQIGEIYKVPKTFVNNESFPIENQDITGLGERYGMGEPTIKPLTQQEKFLSIQSKIKNIASQLGGIQTRIATEGITDKTGKVLLPAVSPTISTATTSPLPIQKVEPTIEPKQGLYERIKSYIQPVAKTTTQRTEELLPAIPTRLGEIDKELANLRTSYQQGDLEIQNQQVPMHLMVGQQAALSRQYEIKKQGILAEREVIQGDYDRATIRAKTILDLEREDAQVQREAEKTAINYLWQEVSQEEKNQLELYKYALEQQNKLADRQYKQQEEELDDIVSIMAKSPQAFFGKGMPKSIEEAITIAGGEKAITTRTVEEKNYQTRLNKEISNLYSKRYGEEGAREKVINMLQNEFPNVDVAKDIYNRVPDNWDTLISETKKSSVVSKMIGAFQQSKDLGFTRQQVLDKFKTDNGIDMPDNLITELNKIYPEQTKNWWEFWK